jgi:hypothetical protein
MDPRIDQTSPAPSEVRDHHGRERPAYGAGKSAEQGQRRDGPARALAVEPAQGGEGGVVKTGAHADAEHQPGYEIDRQRRGARARPIKPRARSTALTSRTGRPPRC